jgi:hypothetical protein
MSLTSSPLPVEKVLVAPSALISMSTLSDSERAHVLQTLAHLATLPPEQWPADKVHLRRSQESVYLLEATDQLRVFFRRDRESTLTIIDLVMQEALDLYISKTA